MTNTQTSILYLKVFKNILLKYANKQEYYIFVLIFLGRYPSTLERHSDIQAGLGHYHCSFCWELGILHPPYESTYVHEVSIYQLFNHLSVYLSVFITAFIAF